MLRGSYFCLNGIFTTAPPGILSTPPVISERRDWGTFTKRCFKIGRRKIEVNEVSAATKSLLIDHPVWGSRNGQSLSEVDPDHSI